MTPDRKDRSSSTKVPKLCIGQAFNPYKLFTGIFIPEALVRYRGLTSGAKIAYGRLARYAGENGLCFPSIPTLASETGIHVTQARTYVHELRERRFIAIEERPGTTAVYKFLWHEAFAGEIGEKRKAPPLRKTGGVPVRKTEGVPLRKTGPPPLRKTGDEENHHQESQMKESQVKESQVKESQAGALVKAAIVRRTENQNSFISPPDDDGRNHRAPVGLCPWEELRKEYQEANNGADMAFQDECWLKEQMELRGISPADLVKLVHANPLTGFRSPMAGLKWLVNKFRIKTCSKAELDFVAEALIASSRPIEAPRCEECGNTGRILERIEGEARPRMTDQYCACRMGREIEAVERKHTAKAPLDGNPVQARPTWVSGAPSRETGAHYAN